MGGFTRGIAATATGRIAQPPPAALQSQTITFNAIPDKLLSTGSFTVSATASSGLAVTFTTTTPTVCTSGGSNGSVITLLTTGTCTVVADQAGSGTYSPAVSVSRSFQVTNPPPPPGPQTITFAPLVNQPTGSPPVTVSASASSGLPVTFTSSTPGVCTSSGSNGSTITVLTTGTCTINANQPGDAR